MTPAENTTPAKHSSERDERHVWDAIAPSWNEYRVIIPPTVEAFVATITGAVLDIGCGSGRTITLVPGITWHGVDFSESMIAYARENVQRRGITAKFSVMDAQHLNYADNTFDAVICYSMLHCIKGEAARARILSEIHRVLKPGGVALISVWGQQSPRLRNEAKECLVPWNARIETPVLRYTYIYDAAELTHAIEAAGLVVTRLFEERNVNAIVMKPNV